MSHFLRLEINSNTVTGTKAVSGRLPPNETVPIKKHFKISLMQQTVLKPAAGHLIQ